MTPWRQQDLELDGLELPDTFPRDLVAEIPFRLPLAFVSIEGLTTKTLEQWLMGRRIPYRTEGPHRRLHGALAAKAGRGVAFLDATDDVAEQRFTVAHETAHFLQDHLTPRQQALKALGETIRPVLDGKRRPTPEESVSALLSRVPLGVHVHLMARNPNGTTYGWETEKSEQRADRLALELLAPIRAVRRILRHRRTADAVAETTRTAKVLADYFGLPMTAALAYANLLLDARRARPKLSEILLGGRP
jgi:hypothetical protein